MFNWIKKLFGSEPKPETLVLTNPIKTEDEVQVKKRPAAKAPTKPKAAPRKKKAKVDFDAMTKTQIDAYADERGIKLDRRKKKQTMIEELKTQLKEK